MMMFKPWPDDLVPSQVQLRLQAHTARFASPYSRSAQTQELPGARFLLSLTLPPRRRDAMRAVRAWFAALRGSVGRFYFRAEHEVQLGAYPIPAAGAAEPPALVPLTSDHTGLTVDCTRITVDATVRSDPWPATAAAGTDPAVLAGTSPGPTGAVVAQAGMHISFDDATGWRHLHLLTADAVVQRSGAVRFAIEPPLRAFPVAGAPIHTRFPSGIFQLSDDDQGAQTLQSSRIASEMIIDAIEARPMRLPA